MARRTGREERNPAKSRGVVDALYSLISWHRHRPDAWWGVVVLWQFWMALLAAAAFVISATRDTRNWYHPTLGRKPV